MQSELQKFIFEGLPVKGTIVRLSGAWHELVLRRASSADPYPAKVCSLLGEMSAAALLMHANIKFDGVLLIQILASDHDKSPIKFAAAEARADGRFRATAKVVGTVKGEAHLSQLINASNKAKCAITLDMRDTQPNAQPYQGVVPLFDDAGVPLEKFSEVLEHYMLQSEQLDTKLILAANNEVAAGLLLQRIPSVDGQTVGDDLGKNEDFNRLALLAASLKDEELLTLSVEDILHRLFWDEPLARFENAGSVPKFSCTCSRERVAKTIRNLGQTEAEAQVESQNGLEANCDFCGASYKFDAAQTAQIFKD